MVWPNSRLQDDGAVEPCTLRFAPALRWFMLGGPAFLLALIGLIYFGLPPSQQTGREIVAPMAAVIAAAGLGAFALFSRPALRLDSWGIRETAGRKVAWESIVCCRIEIRRNIVGDVFWVSIHALGEGEKRLATFSLLGHGRPQQQDFLLALHHALQPGEEAPDIAQVLGDEPEPRR